MYLCVNASLYLCAYAMPLHWSCEGHVYVNIESVPVNVCHQARANYCTHTLEIIAGTSFSFPGLEFKKDRNPNIPTPLPN